MEPFDGICRHQSLPTCDFPLLYKSETIPLTNFLFFEVYDLFFNTMEVIYCLFHRGNETSVAKGRCGESWEQAYDN